VAAEIERYTWEEFDEELYLSANPDVRAMLAQGTLSTALEHWRANGAEEHERGLRRSGFRDYDLEYEEASYLRSNEDVRAAIQAGHFRDGYEHWIRYGRRECAEGHRLAGFGSADRVVRPFNISRSSGCSIARRGG